MVPAPPLHSSQGEAAEQICLLDNNAGWKKIPRQGGVFNVKHASRTGNVTVRMRMWG